MSPRHYLVSLINAKGLLMGTFLLAFLLFILGPFTMILIKSVSKLWGPDWLPQVWTFEEYWRAWRIADIPRILTNSLVIAGIAVLVSTLVALPTSWALARRNVPGKELLLATLLLPRLIPPLAFAVGIARIFYTIDLVDTHFGVALAHVAVAAPFAILILTSTFESLDDRLLEAASVCGANALRTFTHVTLPLIAPGILSSMIFTFAASYDEFTLTIMTFGPHTITLPIQVYSSFSSGDYQLSSAVAVVLMIPSLTILLILQRWLRPDKLIGGLKGS